MMSGTKSGAVGSGSGQGGQTPTIVSVQALRAVAAFAVVLCHFSQLNLMIQGRPNDPIPLYALASGVDLFFVISGFVMVYSSEDLFGTPRAWRTFLSRRIGRVIGSQRPSRSR